MKEDSAIMIGSERSTRSDGWGQLIEGLSNGVKTKTSYFTLDRYTSTQLQALVRGDDLAWKIAMLPPRDMLRAGWEIKSDDIKQETQQRLLNRIEELKIIPSILSALFWERVFGGAGLIIGVDDSDDWTQPININKITTINFIRAVSRVDLKPYSFFNDWRSANFGSVELWDYIPRSGFIVGSGVERIHSTRVIPFRPFIVSREEINDNDRYWGDSIFTRIYSKLAQFNTGYNGASKYIDEMAALVLKLPGFNELLAANKESELTTLLLSLKLMRSMSGIIAMDSEDSLEQQQIAVGGLSDVLISMQQRIAAATGIPAIPATLLFGKSPDGLNATGDGDIRLYYDQIKAEQSSKLVYPLDKIYQLLFAEKSGVTAGKIPNKWTYGFKSLWLTTEKEQAEIRYIMAQADNLYLTNNSGLSGEEVLKSRFGAKFSVDTTLDSEYRDAYKRIQESETTIQETQSPEPTTQAIDKPTNSQTAAAINVSEILTPSDAAVVFTVNQILKLANQPPVPNGDLSVYEYKAQIDSRIQKTLGTVKPDAAPTEQTNKPE